MQYVPSNIAMRRQSVSLWRTPKCGVRLGRGYKVIIEDDSVILAQRAVAS